MRHTSPGNYANEPDDTFELLDGFEAWNAEAGTIDAEDLLHRRASLRKRATQAGLALLCALIVFGLLHTAATLPKLEIAPDATPNTSTIWVSVLANLSFGTVSVDGRKLSGKPPFFFHVRAGGDTVVFSAPPFAVHSCRVSWASDNGAPARLNTSGSNCSSSTGDISLAQDGQVMTFANAIEFEFSLDDLPANLQATALSFVHQVVMPAIVSATIAAGEYYPIGRDANGNILSQQATTPLTAQISLLLPNAQDLALPTSYCPTLICAGTNIIFQQNGSLLPTNEQWATMVPLAMDWLFQAANGQVLGMEHQSQVAHVTSLVLALDTAQSWHLAQFSAPTQLLDQQRQLIPSTICNTGVTELENNFQQHNVYVSTTNATDRGLAGCEIQLMQNTNAIVGGVIWRWGVLLAADRSTQAAYPWLPLAPKSEVDAVSG